MKNNFSLSSLNPTHSLNPMRSMHPVTQLKRIQLKWVSWKVQRLKLMKGDRLRVSIWSQDWAQKRKQFLKKDFYFN